MNQINTTFLEKFEKLVRQQRFKDTEFTEVQSRSGSILPLLGVILVPFSQHKLNSWSLFLVSSPGTQQMYGISAPYLGIVPFLVHSDAGLIFELTDVYLIFFFRAHRSLLYVWSTRRCTDA